MSDVLNAEPRDTFGSRNTKKLRQKGRVPAVVYGHGQPTVSISLSADELGAVIRHGSHVVDLQGAISEKALIKAVQWDTYGLEVLHLDLARVSLGERVQVSLAIELKGSAPGTKEGGVVEHLIHNLNFECPAISVPEKIVVNINHLKLTDTITVAQLSLPEGMKVLEAEPTAVVVQCVEPTEEVEADAGSAPAEPELIGRKPKDEEDEEK